MSSDALFTPARIGNLELAHRVVLGPATRLRNTAEHVPTDLTVTYYAQRASVPGTLLISEGCVIAPQAGGIPFVPGMWNQEQVEAWKKVRR